MLCHDASVELQIYKDTNGNFVCSIDITAANDLNEEIISSVFKHAKEFETEIRKDLNKINKRIKYENKIYG